MAGSLPTSEITFYEETASVQAPRVSLIETLDLLMDDTWCGVENVIFLGNSIFGLFTVICGMLINSPFDLSYFTTASH